MKTRVLLLALTVSSCVCEPGGLREQFTLSTGCKPDDVSVKRTAPNEFTVSGCGNVAEYRCERRQCVERESMFVRPKAEHPRMGHVADAGD